MPAVASSGRGACSSGVPVRVAWSVSARERVNQRSWHRRGPRNYELFGVWGPTPCEAALTPPSPTPPALAPPRANALIAMLRVQSTHRGVQQVREQDN